MNLSLVTGIRIPDGNVQQILSGETVLWEEPSLPTAYQQVKYIHNPSTAYIDTGFKHNQDTRVVMKVQATSMNNSAFAFEGRSSDSLGVKGVFFHLGYGDVWKANYEIASNHIEFPTIDRFDLLKIDYNRNICTINGETITHTKKTFQSNHNLTLLARNTGGIINNNLVGNLYYTQIYDNDTLIRNYYPCFRKSDGVYGLYDFINNEFVTSASSVAFTGT